MFFKKLNEQLEKSIRLLEAEDFNALSRSQAERVLHSILSARTKGVFSDNHWLPYQQILTDLDKHGIDFGLVKSEYYRNKGSTHPIGDGKRWSLNVYYGDKGGWYLNIIASFGPSKPNETDKYDMIYSFSWSAAIKKSK